MGREFELKFRANEDGFAGVRQAYGEFAAISMETTYYDTPTGELDRRRWTLRRRLENGISVCTVKTPAPDGGRGEWETGAADIWEAIPKLCKLGAPEELILLTEKGIAEVCAARFTRLVKHIDTGACSVELALDQGVLLGGGKELPLCEIEVELKTGSESAAVDFACRLAARFALTPEPKSKYRRASALAKGE